MAKIRLPNPAQQAVAIKQARFASMSRLSKAMSREFTLQSLFKLGYRNKEDVSNLPPYVLVVGSQNVLTNGAEQVTIRNGIVLDGPAGNQNTYGVDSSYDFNTHTDSIRNLRKWGPNLEVRYVNPVTGSITWEKLISNLIPTKLVNFTDFWDTTNVKNLLLFVNGGPVNGGPLYTWSGGMGSYLSATSSTLTVSGSKTLASLGFSSAGAIVVDGTTFSYTAAGVAHATVFNQSPTNTKVPLNSSAQRNAQLFTTNSAATQITSAVVRCNALASQTAITNFTAGIYTDNAGVPGTLVGYTVNATPGPIGMATDFTVTFDFTGASVQVSGSTNYHLVISTTGTSGNNISIYTGNTPAVGTNTSSDNGATWATENGYMSATVVENDTNTTTFTGVTPDPTGVALTVGDVVLQPAGAAAAPTGIPTTFSFDLIAAQNNQVYYGSLLDHTVYISAVDDYTTCAFSTPRTPGQGASATLDAPPVGFITQDDSMLVSAGMDFWYNSKFTLSADLADETFSFARLKTTSNQGAQSQALMAKMKNNVIFVSFEPIFNTLGTTKDFLNSPQTTNLSDPIRNDMDAYDFASGSCYYFNYYLYFTVPTMGVVRMYNLQKKYWEAPQVMGVGRFYQVDGLLYGHSPITNESYQVFVPGVYNDNGNPIQAVAAFPYVSSEGAQPNQQKFFNRLYTEGYIAGNTSLTVTVNYDFGAFSGTYSAAISGADSKIIFNRIIDGSLGQNTLGTQPIGTILNLPENNSVPKFRIINTFPPVNNYEYQIVYSSYDIDTNWAILRFGPAVKGSTDMPTSISQ